MCNQGLISKAEIKGGSNLRINLGTGGWVLQKYQASCPTAMMGLSQDKAEQTGEIQESETTLE